MDFGFLRPARGAMSSNPLVARSDRVFQRFKELCRIHSNGLANGQKFHHVDAGACFLEISTGVLKA
jgi:hypothetical protein